MKIKNYLALAGLTGSLLVGAFGATSIKEPESYKQETENPVIETTKNKFINEFYNHVIGISKFNITNNLKNFQVVSLSKSGLEKIVKYYSNNSKKDNITGNAYEDLTRNYGLNGNSAQEIIDILKGIKYSVKPIREFAGKMPENNEINILSRDEEKEVIYEATGLASMYHSKNCKRDLTATGGKIQNNKNTAAISLYWGVPLPALFKVENLDNGQEAYFVADNTGPYKITSKGLEWVDKKRGLAKPHQKRVIDLSSALAKQIGISEKQGIGRVRVRYIADLSSYLGK